MREVVLPSLEIPLTLPYYQSHPTKPGSTELRYNALQL